MGKNLVPGKMVPCRKCGKNVSETAKVCNYCGTLSPSINSQCPNCGSTNYEWRTMGFCISRAIGGMLLLGPLGLGAGMIGFNDVECICRNCGQGWLPFGVAGGKLSQTKKYRR